MIWGALRALAGQDPLLHKPSLGDLDANPDEKGGRVFGAAVALQAVYSLACHIPAGRSGAVTTSRSVRLLSSWYLVVSPPSLL